MNLSIRALQSKVNEIARQMGGIDSLEKLEQACQIASQDPGVKGLMADILSDAIARRYRSDTALTIKQFLAAARGHA